MKNTTVIQSNNLLIVNGVRMEKPKGAGNNVTVINGKVYIDGYELINGKWKRTIKALWYKLF